MAKKKKKSQSFHGYKHIEIPADRMDEFRKTWHDDAWQPDCLQQLCDSYHRITLSYDEYNQCYKAVVTGLEGSGNDGWAVTARSGSVTMALGAVLFKCCEVAVDGQWPSQQQKPIDYID